MTSLAVSRKTRRPFGEKLDRHTGDSSINRMVYADPDPRKVAELLDKGYGIAACLARWPGVGERTLISIARLGRVQTGIVAQNNGRPRSETPEREAAAIATAYVLSNVMAAEKAAGFRRTYMQNLFNAFGIADPPRTPSHQRAENTSVGHAAARGDARAPAAVDQRLARDRAVFEVCLAALSILPLQTRGRPVLPPPSPELDRALAGLDPTAIAAVFPTLAVAAPVPDPAPSQETKPMAYNRAPAEHVIRADVVKGYGVNELADRWGITSSGVRYALRKHGLSVRMRPIAEMEVEAPRVPAPVEPTNVLPFAPVPVEAVPVPVAEQPVSIGASSQPGRTRLLTRLDQDGLVAAVALARATGLNAIDALEWVRADAALTLQDTRHLRDLSATG